jgi:hypothetical protein
MSDSHQTAPFTWNAKRHRAAILVAEDDLPDHAIAKEVGIGKRTLEDWKAHPDFMAQVGGHIGQLQASALKFSIAKRHKRVGDLDKLYRKAMDVVELRAAQYCGEADTPAEAARRIFRNGTVPEAVTGLLVKKESISGNGIISTEWAVDTGLLKEIRALQEQAAKELGQWVERSESEQTTTIVQIVGVEAGAI